MGKVKRKEDSKKGLRVVAFFEGAKGLLVLFVGFGILTFIHKDLHSFAEQLVRILIEHRQPFAIPAGEFRLGIEGVNLRRAAIHEQKDDALGPRLMMGQAQPGRG